MKTPFKYYDVNKTRMTPFRSAFNNMCGSGSLRKVSYFVSRAFSDVPVPCSLLPFVYLDIEAPETHCCSVPLVSSLPRSHCVYASLIAYLFRLKYARLFALILQTFDEFVVALWNYCTCVVVPRHFPCVGLSQALTAIVTWLHFLFLGVSKRRCASPSA
jgi:hypothetical protein